MPTLIHPDQTGFIKGQHSSNNTRRLFNIINNSTKQKTNTIIVSLDAEKAFDEVNWHFLNSTLEKYGFGKSFIRWIKLLYNTPSALLQTILYHHHFYYNEDVLYLHYSLHYL